MDFRVITAREQGEAKEKCPICRYINRNMIQIGEASDGMLACFECGCVFMSKEKRADIRTRKTEAANVSLATRDSVSDMMTNPQVATTDETDEQDGEFVCEVCGQSCKSLLGLRSHMRKHESAS